MSAPRIALVALVAAALTLTGCAAGPTAPRGVAQGGQLRAAMAAPAVVAALGQALAPLTTVMPGDDLADLAPIGRAIGNARVVGLGEASHGTAEFFRMKHRLFRYLVEQRGFTVFAIEANWASTLAADRFVKTGQGSAAAALGQMGFWTWRTAEVRDLLDWIRAYNQAHGPVLSVAGFDMQNPRHSFEAVPAYLKLLGPEAANRAEAAYATYREAWPAQKYFELPAAQRAQSQAAIAAIESLLDSQRAALVAASTPEAWRHARQHARVVAQAEAMDREDPTTAGGYNARDAAMAENVRWLADTEFPGRKLIAWAHNGHVGRYDNLLGVGWKVMGSHLGDALGQGYYPLGLSFDRGTVRAIRMENGAYKGLEVIPVPRARPDSIDATLALAGQPLAFLDVRRVPQGGSLGRWLAAPAPMRQIGAAYDPAQDAHGYVETRVTQAFDGLIHVTEGHGSDLLPAWSPAEGARDRVPARRAPRNPAFDI